MAAALSSVTVEVTPVLPEGLQEQIDTAVREAVAAALRNFADSLTAATTAPADEARFYAAHETAGWGVADRETPEEWAYWAEENSVEADVRAVARQLNERPDGRAEWTWSTYGVADDDW